FDPVRSLHRQGTHTQHVEDGSQLLQHLHQWANDQQKSASWERFQRRLLGRLNKLFQPPFNSLVMKGQPKPDLALKIASETATPGTLQNMGRGIAEAVVILASLEADADDPSQRRHYYVEEPESHLHPKLLRQFMEQLRSYDNAQFFISSHSSVVLDSVAEQDRVYLFRQGPA